MLNMWETDFGYFWVPNGKQVSRFEVATAPDSVSLWPVAFVYYQWCLNGATRMKEDARTSRAYVSMNSSLYLRIHPAEDNEL